MPYSILIVEDDLTFATMLKTWLGKKGFLVDTAGNSARARKQLDAQSYNLVLSDLRLPDQDGISLLAWMKEHGHQIPLIIMTGYADIQSAVQAMKNGANDYISKPVQPDVLLKKINEADESRKKLIDGFVNMFGIDKGGSPWITKQSVYNQFYSDLVTKVQHGIDVPGTTIHVFYATKMGEKYEKRYCTYFKNPDIRRHNMQHEELFCCHSAEWVKEVKKAVEGDRQ